MRLIIIYGPPAVGKLTVAEKLPELSGIPLFHNHLSGDLVRDIDTYLEHYEEEGWIRYTYLTIILLVENKRTRENLDSYIERKMSYISKMMSCDYVGH